MDNFPEYLNLKNSDNFKSINYRRICNQLRKEIHDLILKRHDENDYFDIDIFMLNYSCQNIIESIIHEICLELNELGWKTCLAFGETGLFIYSTEEKPQSCW